MRVAVIGGTGSVGRAVAAELARRGDEVRVLSRRAPAALPAGASHHAVDLRDGSGLAAALEGVEAVVDAANSRRRAKEVLVAGTERVLAAGRAAGVGHYVGISIIGIDRVPMSYYKLKLRQEQAIAAGPLPWSVLRAAQFHSLLDGMLTAAARLRLRLTGSALVQPVDEAIVAARLADAVHADPAGMLPEVAGPEVLSASELSRAWQRANPRALLPLPLPLLGRAGRALREGALTNPDAAAGGPTFAEWLARR